MIWLACAIYYLLSVGSLGITSTLALRDLRWPDLILWTGAGYVVVAGLLVITGIVHVKVATGSWWAMLSAALAISGLIALYVGLQHGSTAKVITIGAGYPAVTVVLAALFLSEPLSVPHVLGVVLVIAGCILISAT